MRSACKRIRLLEVLAHRYPDIECKELHARVLCGEILVDNERIRDPQARVREDCRLAFDSRRFVSRGGYKLDGILDLWKIPVQGLCFLDAGASTGGFTDCLLQRGAKMVYAVDVGRGQLHERLRRDDRVRILDRTNLMDLEPASLDPGPEAAVADLSFRSLRRAAARLLELTRRRWAIVLAKPQFEWRRPAETFRGVVPVSALYGEILCALVEDLFQEGAYVSAWAPSPLAGRKGNRELFLLLDAEPKMSLGEVQEGIRRFSADGPGL